MTKFCAFIFLFCAFCGSLSAQCLKQGEYSMSTLAGKYPIYVNLDERSGSSWADVWLSVYDARRGFCSMFGFASADALDGFISSLLQAKDKFAQWSKVAQKNNLTSHLKNIPASFRSLHVVSNSAPDEVWHLRRQDLFAKFFVDSEGHSYLVILQGGTSVTTSNMHSEISVPSSSFRSAVFCKFAVSPKSKSFDESMWGSANLIFASEGEIDAFISQLQAIRKWEVEHHKQSALFD